MLVECVAMCLALGQCDLGEIELPRHHRRSSIGYAMPVENAPEPVDTMQLIEGNACTEGAETLPCIYEPGLSGMVKIELTGGERAKLILKTRRGTNTLPIRSGNTLLLNLPADAILSLAGSKDEPVQIHWTFKPRS